MDVITSLIAIACGASLFAAVFSFLSYLAARPPKDSLTLASVAKLLREETEVARGSAEANARGLRQELINSIARFQDAIVTGFGALGHGIEGKIKEFADRLDIGVTSIEQRTDGIASKLNSDMERMRAEAVTNRENLRSVVEQKLDQNLANHAEAAKLLKDELSDNFHRLGTRVNDSLSQSSEVQGERLINVTEALGSLSERLERAQENVRTTVESRLEAIRNDNAAKLDQMRSTVEEKLHDTLEQRLSNSFKLVSDQLEQVFRGLGEMQNLATGVGDLKRMMTNVKARGTWGR